MSPRPAALPPLSASGEERERQWRLMAEVDSALRTHIEDSREERTRVDEQIAMLRQDQRDTRAEVHELRGDLRDLRGEVRGLSVRSAAGAGGVAMLLPAVQAIGHALGWW